MTRHDPDIMNLLASRPSLHMDAQDGLIFEGVPLQTIASQMGTPCWVMGAGTLRRRTRNLRKAFTERGLGMSIHYALKANDHLATLAVLRQEGCGADIVSGGELRRACQAGIHPGDIVFSGVGKTDAELNLALQEDIGQINVESAEELRRLSRLATAAGAVARVALRVNPHVDADTHDKISTGRLGDKFGIDWAEAPALYREGCALPGLEMIGLATHIGSQILTAAPFRAAYARIAEMVIGLRQEGLPVHAVDCGGGLGIRYRDELAPPPSILAGAIAETLGSLDLRLAIEPGRWIAAPAGVLLTSVIGLKAQREGISDFAIVDAAMNDLARPSLYDSWHGMIPLAPDLAYAETAPLSVVGPVCESSDVFARDRALPPLRPDDRIAILDTGAYGAVMSSTYNARPRAAQVMVENGAWEVITPRQRLESLWADDSIPEWLGAG
ncbi:diaminopimelate decarboxylase [Swaminathania salitolerans]|uniref:Diaminopimelate decarboxylase n=1 Tax=Swaminathania salitolerans TaxID=182838 RepID=A0A511BMK6_9PROT|nr:diaminopimelate decarboxylase [Swaminathania salitolerans]GEL01581.1 diaminopimelate decarboxylase [Swaminathania salitolerans]